MKKARRAGRKAIVASVVMAVVATRTMMNSVRTARAMLTRQMYIYSLERLLKGTVTVIQKTIRTIYTATTRILSSAQN